MLNAYDGLEENWERKPWHRTPGEPDNAYRAFECYLDMPYWDRKDLYAYRTSTGNPEASHVSATWLSWKEEFFWEERVRAYDYYVQKERRERTIQAQVEAGYQRGDELARMEHRMFHVQELFYETLREKLEEDNLLEWRPMNLINLSRVMTESYSAINKACSFDNQDRKGNAQPLTDEEMEILFGDELCSNCGYDKGQGAAEDAGAALPQDANGEDHSGF